MEQEYEYESQRTEPGEVGLDKNETVCGQQIDSVEIQKVGGLR